MVGVMAALWWIPAFQALTDLMARESVPRGLVWKWMAILCLPFAGAVLYRRRGRAELDAATKPGPSRG